MLQALYIFKDFQSGKSEGLTETRHSRKKGNVFPLCPLTCLSLPLFCPSAFAVSFSLGPHPSRGCLHVTSWCNASYKPLNFFAPLGLCWLMVGFMWRNWVCACGSFAAEVCDICPRAPAEDHTPIRIKYCCCLSANVGVFCGVPVSWRLQHGTHTSVFLCLINNLTPSEYGTIPQPSAAPVCQAPTNARNYFQILWWLYH